MPQVFSRLRWLCSLASAPILCIALCAPLAAQSLSPAGPITFGSVNVGNTAKATLTFSAPTPTTISSVAPYTEGVRDHDFYVTQQNCTGVVTSCTIQLSFTPFFAGPRDGYIALFGAGGITVARAYLFGVGINGQVAFTPSTITAAASSSALTPAAFTTTSAVADGTGNIFFNDIVNSRLLKFTTAGVYASIASLTGSARSSIALGADGTVYASSPTQGVVYAIPPGGTATALSTGTVPVVTPTGLVPDGLGNLYIADAANARIVRTALDGSGSTVVPLTGFTLSNPAGLTIDANNNLFIVDSGNDRIIEFNLGTNAASVVSITGLSLNNPSAVAVDPSGTLYIADTGNQRIVVSPPGATAYALPLPGVTLAAPAGVALVTSANLVLADPTAGLINVARSSLTVNFPTPTNVGAVDTTDGFQTFTVQNTGNIVMRYVPLPTSANPVISSKNFTDSGGSFTCPVIPASSPTSSQIALGASCTYAVEFTPVNSGAITSTFTMYVADLGTSGVSDAPVVKLTATGTSPLVSFTIVATPSTATVGAPVSFTVTAFNSVGKPAPDYLGTVTLTSTDSTAVFLGGSTYTFTASDAGIHTFTGASAIAFHQFGAFTIAVADNSINATSNPVQVQAQSAVSLTATPNPVLVGASVALSATVTSATSGVTRTPTGTVTFSSTSSPGATPVTLGTATLNSSGVATLNTSFSAAGSPCITAAYSGDTAFAISTSSAVCETVGDFSIKLDSASSANATTVYGQPVSYTFDVAPLGSSTFGSNISFTVTGLDAAAPFTLTPPTISSGAGPSTVKLTITPISHQARRTLALNHIAPLALALLALPFAWWPRRRKLGPFIALLALLAVLTFPAGCSSNSGYFNPAFWLYKITVTANSGSVSHSVVVNLTAE